ncbi:AMP-binding protein [Microseira wollei]|uniref:Amino acid adenylation domain-containing protein n=1 Tax=Microseira wollei NIES-4236 TaxID=2530354 RepID=A0AAV3XHH0_9CYAN|nr:AMP-binding protein [Microseira wollei]GET42377.1 amino acid adenylation domain-containing protein [Microseira wollei NIES-4236]
MEELIDELASDQVLAKQQNLDERTYFPRSQRLLAGGILSFNCCACDMDAVVRGLDFGSYCNRLGLAKLAIGSELLVVSKVEVLAQKSESPPGTVTAIEPGFLRVATASYDIALRQVLTMDGQTQSLSDLVDRFGLQVGYRFGEIESDRTERIEQLHGLIAQHEAFWVERLGALQPIAIPHAQRMALRLEPKRYGCVKMPVSDGVTAFLTQRYPDWNPGVPSAIAELVRAKRIPDGVGTVNLAGEALPLQVVELLYQQETIQEVFNLDGPSEDTVYSTYALVRQDGQKAPPIGRPIANTQTYILDADRQPVPIGVPGELHLGGAGLARGYLNRPELTEQKFISHRFNKEPEARLDKTGDVVRYLPDGNIEFLGPIDHQVKIRGNRIELAELESVLGQHPNLREVVVTAREDVPGDKRLFADVARNHKQGIIVRKLRRCLKDKLPDYMMPSAFVLLSKLPRTPNGKVDRRALPAPDQARPELEETFEIPRTPVEEVLVGIWTQVLGLDKVGVQDNFFELGGHSLLATQVISRVRDAFSVELSLYSLFEAPTITSLAEKVEAARREGVGLQAPPILPRTIEDQLPRNAFYGNGEPIENTVLDQSGIYQKTAVTLSWQKGDILMLDNFLASHGREILYNQEKS